MAYSNRLTEAHEAFLFDPPSAIVHTRFPTERSVMSIGEDAGIDVSTARGRDWPSVRQFNVFVANRVGALVNVFRCFENTDVRVLSISIVDTADCAIIRMVLNDPERGVEIFERAGLMYTESDLLVVQLPESKQPLLQICKALLSGEVNLHYAYPLLVGPNG